MTRRPMRAIALTLSSLLVLVAVPAADLAAQRPTGFSPLSVFQLADRQAWVLRASLTDGATIVGRVRGISDVSALLEGGRVPFAELILLERGERHGGGAWTGAVVGGAILGGLTAFALMVAPLDDPDRDETDFLLAISAGAAVGAVTGGLIGAALFPSAMRWRPIWPSGSTGMQE